MDTNMIRPKHVICEDVDYQKMDPSCGLGSVALGKAQLSPLVALPMCNADIAENTSQPLGRSDIASCMAQLRAMVKAADLALLSQTGADNAAFSAFLKSLAGADGDASPPADANASSVTSVDRPIRRAFAHGSRVLRMKAMVERTGLSRATLYSLLVSDPTFPLKIKLTPRTIGFLEADVDSWIAARANKGGAS